MARAVAPSGTGCGGVARHCQCGVGPCACRCGQHEHGGEERGCPARDVETHLLYSHSLLPAGDTRTGLYLTALKALGRVELLDILVRQFDGSLQLGRYQTGSLVKLLSRYGQGGELRLVKLLFVLQ